MSSYGFLTGGGSTLAGEAITVTPNPTNNTVNVSWGDNYGVPLRIEKSTDNGTTWQTATLQAALTDTSTSAVVTGVALATPTDFRVVFSAVFSSTSTAHVKKLFLKLFGTFMHGEGANPYPITAANTSRWSLLKRTSATTRTKLTPTPLATGNDAGVTFDVSGGGTFYLVRYQDDNKNWFTISQLAITDNYNGSGTITNNSAVGKLALHNVNPVSFTNLVGLSSLTADLTYGGTAIARDTSVVTAAARTNSSYAASFGLAQAFSNFGDHSTADASQEVIDIVYSEPIQLGSFTYATERRPWRILYNTSKLEFFFDTGTSPTQAEVNGELNEGGHTVAAPRVLQANELPHDHRGIRHIRLTASDKSGVNPGCNNILITIYKYYGAKLLSGASSYLDDAFIDLRLQPTNEKLLGNLSNNNLVTL